MQGYTNYSFERDTRQGGGVILYVREGYTVRNVHEVKIDTCVESVWLDIKSVGNIWLRVGLFYRSPCPPNGQDANYMKLLNKKYISKKADQ